MITCGDFVSAAESYLASGMPHDTPVRLAVLDETASGSDGESGTFDRHVPPLRAKLGELLRQVRAAAPEFAFVMHDGVHSKPIEAIGLAHDRSCVVLVTDAFEWEGAVR